MSPSIKIGAVWLLNKTNEMMTATPKRAMDITITALAIFLLSVLLTFIDYHPNNLGVGQSNIINERVVPNPPETYLAPEPCCNGSGPTKPYIPWYITY